MKKAQTSEQKKNMTDPYQQSRDQQSNNSSSNHGAPSFYPPCTTSSSPQSMYSMYYPAQSFVPTCNNTYPSNYTAQQQQQQQQQYYYTHPVPQQPLSYIPYMTSHGYPVNTQHHHHSYTSSSYYPVSSGMYTAPVHGTGYSLPVQSHSLFTNNNNNDNTLQQQFLQAVNQVNAAMKITDSNIKIDQNDMLELYGYYKQATEGDNLVDSVPLLTGFKQRAKHAAWKKCRGMSKEEAMQRYIQTVQKIEYKVKQQNR